MTAAVRADGSSRFGADTRWGTFPSVSAGWRVSEEPFFSVPSVTQLKLKAGFGVTGNYGIGNYDGLGADRAAGLRVRRHHRRRPGRRRAHELAHLVGALRAGRLRRRARPVRRPRLRRRRRLLDDDDRPPLGHRLPGDLRVRRRPRQHRLDPEPGRRVRPDDGEPPGRRVHVGDAGEPVGKPEQGPRAQQRRLLLRRRGRQRDAVHDLARRRAARPVYRAPAHRALHAGRDRRPVDVPKYPGAGAGRRAEVPRRRRRRRARGPRRLRRPRQPRAGLHVRAHEHVRVARARPPGPRRGLGRGRDLRPPARDHPEPRRRVQRGPRRPRAVAAGRGPGPVRGARDGLVPGPPPLAVPELGDGRGRVVPLGPERDAGVHGPGRLVRAAPGLRTGRLYVSVQNALLFSGFDGNPEIRKALDSPILRNINYGSYPTTRTVTVGLTVGLLQTAAAPPATQAPPSRGNLGG